MSRKRQKISSSQFRPSQSSSSVQDHSQSHLSQSSLLEFYSNSQDIESDLEDNVNNCIRYIIYRAGSNLPIRKSELHEHVLHGIKGRQFDLIIGQVTAVLKRVYGYNLQLCKQPNGSKQYSYIVSNMLPYIEDDSGEENGEESLPENVHHILIMLVLTHIFMSRGSVTDASLYAFLKTLGIDVDQVHELFGNVRTFINSAMVKQKYLDIQIESMPKQLLFSWGARAEKDVSKLALLNFVAKMYGNRTPESWHVQFMEARQQKAANVAEMQQEEEIIEC